MVEQNREAPPGAESEAARLRALYAYDVLDTPSEETFDRITRLAKQALQAPIAMISLIDRDRQWFKSRQGVEIAQTPRDVSFCTHTICRDEPLIVRDALDDARFSSSPLVTGKPHIRSYFGVPLRTPSGHNIGALCVNDVKPRDVTKDQLQVLQDLARLVVDELELRKLATVDSLTGAMTARAFLAEACREVERAQRHTRSLACILLDIDHFKAVNDTFGHAAGDLVLAKVVAACRSKLRAADQIGRLGGEEFAILLPETGVAARRVAEGLRATIAALVVVHMAQAIRVTASFGVAQLSPIDCDFRSMLARADKALYLAKDAGRDEVMCLDADGPAALPSRQPDAARTRQGLPAELAGKDQG